jgi:hypothetical protein
MKFNLEYLTNQLNFNIEDISLKELNFDELRYNLFSYLENYEKMEFVFVNLPNKLINITNPQNTYSLFGMCFLGYFVIGESGDVLLICNDDGFEVFQKKVVFVNSSLKFFVSSYSLFLSKIFILKSKFYEIKPCEVESISNSLMNDILNLEGDLSKQFIFWEHMVYLIEDDGIVLRDDIVNYVGNGG